MKTTITIIAMLMFSALMMTPTLPKDYPPKAVIEQRKDMVFKEQQLNNLINKIEYKFEVDSIHIENISK